MSIEKIEPKRNALVVELLKGDEGDSAWVVSIECEDPKLLRELTHRVPKLRNAFTDYGDIMMVEGEANND